MISSIFLMFGNSGGESSEGGNFQLIIMMVLLFAVFYFFIIRPQQKRNKDLKKFREALAKGDKIVTIGGIHGKVLEIQETTIIIEVEGQNKLKIEKSAIAIDAASGQEQLQQKR